LKLISSDSAADAAIVEKLSDLQKYFSAKSLLAEKYNEQNLKNTVTQLGTVKQKYEAVSDLKKSIEGYKSKNDGLKDMITKINALNDVSDKKSIMAVDADSRLEKRNRINTIINAYIFDYDFNFADYPYLSKILVEIIKTKQRNTDANANKDMGYLLKEL
jgi:hypothetical protein